MAKKPGVYDAVIGDLPPVPDDEADQGQRPKVNAFKDKIKAKEVHTAESLGKAYKSLRRGIAGADALFENDEVNDFAESMIELLGKEGLAALEKIINVRVKAYEELLAESHDQDEPGWGMYGASDNMVKFPSGGGVQVLREPTGKVKDKEAFRLWCIANGLETTLQLWPSTMNSIVKDRCVKGMPAPDGVEVFALTKIKLYKGDDD